MNKLATAAEFYLKKGWNPVPVNFAKAVSKNGKVEKQILFPVKWQIYEKERVTSNLINEWWGKSNGIAIVTGEISGITVMDLDIKNLPEKVNLPKTFTVETKKGFHLYFKFTDKVITNANSFKKGDLNFNIDIRNNGGIVFADPSEYELPDGTMAKYKIIVNAPLAEFPIEWLGKIYEIYGHQPGEKDRKEWKNKLINPISQGRRNMDFTAIVGGFLNKFPQDEWEPIVWPAIQDKNKAQENPLSEPELRTIFMSIAQKELRKRNTGGDIKDISTECDDEEVKINIQLEQAVICFKAKNLLKNLFEGNLITWIKKPSGLSYEMPFYMKIKSDSNKEQLARILSRAFDKKEEKEVYPWTILVTKAYSEIEKAIKEHVQDFVAEGKEAKEVTWMLEPFIQEDQINTFFGLGSSGKTLIAMYFATIAAEDKGITTMLIDYENDMSSWVDKLRKIVKSKDEKKYIYYDSEQIPLSEQIDKIREVIKKYNIKLVIVDSASLASGDSTSDEKAALRLVSALKLLKTTVVLIAHQRKNDGEKNPMGSIQ